MPPRTGNALWHLLHGYARSLPEGPLSEEQQAQARTFLTTFDQAVQIASAGTCQCHQHWRAIREARPPDLRSRRAFWWWTAAIHDDVNTRLGRPRQFPDLQTCNVKPGT